MIGISGLSNPENIVNFFTQSMTVKRTFDIRPSKVMLDKSFKIQKCLFLHIFFPKIRGDEIGFDLINFR